MSLASRIKSWRLALGLTQEAFSDRIQIPLRTLKGYEMGERHPGADALAAIARTGPNMTWLLTGEGEMQLPTSSRDGAKKPPLQSVAAGKSQQTGEALRSSHARRWEAVIALVEGIEDEGKREAVFNEMFARAEELSELERLKLEVAELSAVYRKAS